MSSVNAYEYAGARLMNDFATNIKYDKNVSSFKKYIYAQQAPKIKGRRLIERK